MMRVRVISLTVVCALVLIACGREPVAPIRIGTFPGPAAEPIFLAQHRGWLPPTDFRLVEFINDGEVMRAFRNGSIEAAFIGLEEVLALAQSGLDPIILFVAAESRGGDAVVAHPDVTSLPDLRGRRVAVQVNSASAYLLRRALATAGITIADLQVVNISPHRHRDAFVRRDVDAVVTTEPVRADIMSIGGVELFSSASLPLEFVGVSIISGTYLEQHSERALTLCTAWRHAEAALRTSADARAWIAGHMQITPEALMEMLDVVRIVSPSESEELLGPPRPRLMATTARIQSFLIESDLLPQTLALDTLFRWPAGVEQAACRG
jgi:NitT/TauT family transport system substrate-binding protein